MILKGNVVAAINAAAVANDPVVNPFAYVNQNFFGGLGTSTTTVSLDGSGNTDVIFSGSHPVLPTYSFFYGTGNGLPHIGLDGTAGSSITGSGPVLNVISSMWTATPVFPSVSVAGPNVTGPSVSYGIIFADVASGVLTVGEWFELPFNAGTVPTFMFVNNTTNPITLSDVGFFVTSTFSPLDNLNLAARHPRPTGQPFPADISGQWSHVIARRLHKRRAGTLDAAASRCGFCIAYWPFDPARAPPLRLTAAFMRQERRSLWTRTLGRLPLSTSTIPFRIS